MAANKLINEKKEALLAEAINNAKNIGKIGAVDYELSAKIKEIANKYNSGSAATPKIVLTNVMAICYLTRALDAKLDATNERNTMAIIAKENLKDVFFSKEILDVRQLVFAEYRRATGLKAGLEYDANEYVQECNPINSIPLVVAAELMQCENSNKLLAKVGAEINLTVTNRDKQIAGGITDNATNIIALGEEYRKSMLNLRKTAETFNMPKSGMKK